MKLSLIDQTKNFPRLLSEFRSKPLSFKDPSGFRQKITTKTIHLRSTPSSLHEVDLSFLHRYHVFPKSLLVFLADWDVAFREMRVGDTILQEACIPPVRRASLKLIVGVRVLEIVESETTFGFRYGTLEGHVERGTSAFYGTLANDSLTFTVQTFSEPANPLNKLFGPSFALPYQAFMTRKALDNLAAQFIKNNPQRVKLHK